MTNWKSWNKSDEIWNSANPTFGEVLAYVAVVVA